MELFIRTQDKHQLLKVCSLSLTYEDENTKIICYDNNDKAWVVGFYKTKERALEVLDEIQKSLYPDIKMLANKIDNNQYGDYVNLKSIFAIKQPAGTLEIHQLQNIVFDMPEN